MIKVGKLVSGEFVIGQDEGSFLMNVMLVRFNVNPTTGQVNKSLIPYMYPVLPALGKMISYDKVIISVQAPEELATEYIESIKNMVEFLKKEEEMKKQPSQQPQQKTGSTQGPIIEPNEKDIPTKTHKSSKTRKPVIKPKSTKK